MPVIPVRCYPREDPAVRIVGEDIVRFAAQASMGEVPDRLEVLEDRVSPAIVAAQRMVSADVPHDIFGKVLAIGVEISLVEGRDRLSDETDIRMLCHDVSLLCAAATTPTLRSEQPNAPGSAYLSVVPMRAPRRRSTAVLRVATAAARRV